MLISLASLVVATIGFIAALYQYSRAKIWERKRYVATECERLFHEPVCRAAFSMLDWNKRRICLYPDNPDYAARFVIVDSGMLAVAFIPHNYSGRPRMRQHDASIRDAFDEFFNRLDLIAQFRKAALIEIEDLAYPLRYLGELMAGRRHMNPKVNRNLKVYLRVYSYDGVIELFEDMGYSLKASDQEVAALQRLCAEGYWERWLASRAAAADNYNNFPEHSSVNDSVESSDGAIAAPS